MSLSFIFSNFFIPFFVDIYKQVHYYYIKETNVNTLHKLGKLINEGSQWFTDIDDYYDPFDVDFGWEDFNLEDPFLV